MATFTARTTAAVIALLGSIAVSASVLAAPIVITDQVDVAATVGGADYGSYSSSNFANQLRNGRHWGDEIANPDRRFDTTQITVDRNDATKTLTFTMRTRFNGNDAPSGTRYADLFFDTATPAAADGFGYSISLGSQTLAPGVYAVDSAATSNALWAGRAGWVYGGYYQLQPGADGYDPAFAQSAPVRLTAGSALTDFSVLVTQTSLGGGLFDLAVAITSISDLALFDAFDVLWATGDCSNDAIWGTVFTAGGEVPEPAGFALLALGLGALACTRRRKVNLAWRRMALE